MKRLFALLVVCILLISCSVAYAVDYSSMTDTELKEQLNAIRNELAIRGFRAENKTVIFDEIGVQIYINGSPTINNTRIGSYLIIPIIIVNNSGKSIDLFIDNSSVNGWTASGSVSSGSVPEGKKAKTQLKFSLENVDEIETIKDFEETEFTIRIRDDAFAKIFESNEPITIFASQDN